MAVSENIVAWLVPTARGSYADKATNMLENTFTSLDISSSDHLSSKIPNLVVSRPQKAIQLTFDTSPKRPGRFVLGTDPRTCDVVLPMVENISRQHCALRFDAQARLVLEDFSEKGTQVWYDWESNGDRTDYSWLLSGTPTKTNDSFPSSNQRITIDIQGVRFQVVVGDFTIDWDAHVARVDKFCEEPSWAQGLTAGWDRCSVMPVPALFSDAPLFKHIFVKNVMGQHIGAVYLWNMAKPWEPMVKAVA